MKKSLFILITLIFALATSCKPSAPLLPNVSGKAGEVLCVIEKADWDGALGQAIHDVLEDEYPFVPVKEYRYTVTHVTHAGFEADMFKVHRNIVFFDLHPQNNYPGVQILQNKWAKPQCVLLVRARSAEQADSVLRADSELVVSAIEQAERNRVIANTRRYENADVYPKVARVFGGSVHVPTGYKLRKIDHNFAWISYDRDKVTQGIFVYRLPVTGDDFDNDVIIARRNEVMKENVPGMFDGTYMITGDYWKPQTRFLRYQGISFAETHGMWEVQGDYMGGPFVSHSFYSPDGSEIIVAEAWVYAPKYNKRQLLRQVESLLYSWEWKTE